MELTADGGVYSHKMRYERHGKRIAKAILRMCAAVCFCALGTATQAQGTRDCGKGVELRLSAPVSRQGSLLLVEVRSAKPLGEVEGEWGERKVLFWHETGGREVRRGLLGVDLEKPVGKYELKIAARRRSGEAVSCRAVVNVQAGKFATERLRVGKEFVEPSPEQLKRAEEEKQRLRTILDQVTPERLWQGKFRVPLDGVNTGGNFGKRRVLNGQPGSPHGGVDLLATTGTPVHAAQRGRVMLAEELFFSGNTVVVDHGLGIYTFYGHLSAMDVEAGDVVEAGAVIGKVGATGRVTGAHLHWGLTVQRARVNPLEIVTLLK